ncbi:MAG TPA: 2-dehydropantoate 2-reductase [Xanthobacteraceae bacterium]|nr:2-dehydropantoate 2-reductase [Xanthobacteraceae bacterium]
MRIGIMAAGAVGGYLGARLAAADHDVVFFARGAHLDALRANGLKIESPLGDLQLKVHATDDPASVEPVDVVVFAVKLWDTEKAGVQIKPIVTSDTRVITLQNGVDSVERLAPILGADVVVGGTAVIATVIKTPGVISHSSRFAQIRCGRADGRDDAKLSAFVGAARSAGLDITLSESIERDRWEKFVFLVGLSGATALTRMPIGAVLADPDTRAYFRALLEEVVAVGRAKGVSLAPDFGGDRFNYALSVPYGMKASLLHDLERGNRLEIDWLAGHVVELGRALGIEVPANTGVYAALKLHRLGRAP